MLYRSPRCVTPIILWLAAVATILRLYVWSFFAGEDTTNIVSGPNQLECPMRFFPALRLHSTASQCASVGESIDQPQRFLTAGYGSKSCCSMSCLHLR